MADDSILDSTKKMLGLESDYTEFDTDIIIHINSVFDTLHQLGLGPADGFTIADKTKKWTDYIADVTNINSVRTLMYLRVRLLFDPPATSFAIESFQKQINQIEWRLNVQVDPGVVV